MDKKKRIIVAVSSGVVITAIGLTALVGLKDNKSIKATGTTVVATTEALATTESVTTEALVKEEDNSDTIDTKPVSSTGTTEKTNEESSESTAGKKPEDETEELDSTGSITSDDSVSVKPEEESEEPEPTPEPEESEPSTPTPTPAQPAPTPAPEPETTTEAPATTEAHTHNWYWVVDQAAWSETIETQICVDEIPTTACNYCGECFTTADALYAHQDAQTDDNHACAGHGTGTPILVYDTVVETIEHEEVGHYECNCGETK